MQTRLLSKAGTTAKAMTRYEAWVPTLVPVFQPAWRCSHPREPGRGWLVIANLRARQILYHRGMLQLLRKPWYAAACERVISGTEAYTGKARTLSSDLTAMLKTEKQAGVVELATQNAGSEAV